MTPDERRGPLLRDARRHGPDRRDPRGDGPRRAARVAVGGGGHRPHGRPRADARADRRRGAAPLLGRLAGHARARREHGQGRDQPGRPAARLDVTPPQPRRSAGRRRDTPAPYVAGARSTCRARPGGCCSPRSSVRFNAAALAQRARAQRVSAHCRLAPYFFPLDVIGAWNRLYGAAGLIQYQFVIPHGRGAGAATLLSSFCAASARVPRGASSDSAPRSAARCRSRSRDGRWPPTSRPQRRGARGARPPRRARARAAAGAST